MLWFTKETFFTNKQHAVVPNFSIFLPLYQSREIFPRLGITQKQHSTQSRKNKKTKMVTTI